METNDISLILLPCWGKTEPPLTLSSLASCLRTNGIKVKVYDFNVELYHLLSNYRKWWNIAFGLDVWENNSFISKFWADNSFLFDILINDVMKSNPSYVGFSVFVSNRFVTERFAERLKIKYPDVKLIFGGPEVSYIRNISEYSERHSYIDYFVIGEGEESLLNIVRGFESERIIKRNYSIKYLDTLPLLDLSDYHFEAYDDSFGFPMYSSRGCPNSCIYCTERIHMGRFRTRSAERILEDVITQKRKYPFLKTFRLQESISNGNIKELEKFADLMIKANLKLVWAMNNSAMRKEMKTHLFQKLRKAGCIFISFGLETPSHRVLKNIGKNLAKNADFGRIVREAYQEGISVGLCIMFGLPGETEEDFQIQLDFLKDNYKYISLIAPSLWFCYFPKQSEGFQNPSKYGLKFKMGSLYWTDREGKNNYLVRLERFVRYTTLVKKLRVPCIFGYETLPDPELLINKYFVELQRHGIEISSEFIDAKKRILSYKASDVPKRRKSQLFRIKNYAKNRLTFYLPKIRFRAKIEKNLENILNILIQKGIPPDQWRRRKEKDFRVYASYEKYIKRINQINAKQRVNIQKKIVFRGLNKLSPAVSRNQMFRIKLLEKTISKIIS